MSSEEYGMNNAPTKDDIVDMPSPSPLLFTVNWVNCQCLHFFEPPASSLSAVWHPWRTEELTPPVVEAAFKQWPKGIGITTPVPSSLGWNNSETCSTLASRVPGTINCNWLSKAWFIGCLPLLISLPHFLIGGSWNHLPNKPFELKSYLRVCFWRTQTKSEKQAIIKKKVD